MIHDPKTHLDNKGEAQRIKEVRARIIIGIIGDYYPQVFCQMMQLCRSCVVCAGILTVPPGYQNLKFYFILFYFDVFFLPFRVAAAAWRKKKEKKRQKKRKKKKIDVQM